MLIAKFNSKYRLPIESVAYNHEASEMEVEAGEVREDGEVGEVLELGRV